MFPNETAEAQEHLVKTFSPGALPEDDNEAVAHLSQAPRVPPRTLARLQNVSARLISEGNS
jgi:hypothetical protein